MYPLPLPTDWHSINSQAFSDLPRSIQDWIECESSLTVRVKELGIAFNVELLSQITQPFIKANQTKLETNDAGGLHREVLLKQGELALVYAQTLMPDTTISGTEQMLAELGNQSLGQVLFQSPQAVRGEIEFALVEPHTALGQYIESTIVQQMTGPCFIRRSLFHLNSKPLLVCECFLPALFKE